MRQDVRSLAVVDHGRRHQPKYGMMVLVVVPLKEGLAEPASIFDGAETIRKTRAVFQGAELTFRIRIVVTDMRPLLLHWARHENIACRPRYFRE